MTEGHVIPAAAFPVHDEGERMDAWAKKIVDPTRDASILTLKTFSHAQPEWNLTDQMPCICLASGTKPERK